MTTLAIFPRYYVPNGPIFMLSHPLGILCWLSLYSCLKICMYGRRHEYYYMSMRLARSTLRADPAATADKKHPTSFCQRGTTSPGQRSTTSPTTGLPTSRPSRPPPASSLHKGSTTTSTSPARPTSLPSEDLHGRVKPQVFWYIFWVPYYVLPPTATAPSL